MISYKIIGFFVCFANISHRPILFTQSFCETVLSLSSSALSMSLISSSALRKWLCFPYSSQVTVPCQVAFCR